MKRNFVSNLFALLLFFVPALPAQGDPTGFSDIQSELEANLSALSGNIEHFDTIPVSYTHLTLPTILLV